MRNPFVHSKPRPGTVFLAAALCLASLQGRAQEEVVVPRVDTALMADDDSVNYFEELAAGDTQRLQRRTIADSVLRQLRADKDFWYANQAPVKRKEPDGPSRPFVVQPWFRALLWTIIITCFLAILVWYLMASDVRLFRRKAASFGPEDEAAPPDDLFSINYRREIERAITARDFRQAIRLLYLETLKELAGRQIIRYSVDFTDTHYLAQLQGTSWYDHFFRLTRTFEYTWYGKFEPAEAAFEQIHRDFLHFKQRLR
ncbi:DUF4129 domain-containing protein [Paraflavisolibacter sp. H34]|uniref:DUF4129 domain-containing protein n=1 Tax=Huijunlia imazamoxiresistens TaxID=3127457 RepID=UPI0030165DF4